LAQGGSGWGIVHTLSKLIVWRAMETPAESSARTVNRRNQQRPHSAALMRTRRKIAQQRAETSKLVEACSTDSDEPRSVTYMNGKARQRLFAEESPTSYVEMVTGSRRRARGGFDGHEAPPEELQQSRPLCLQPLKRPEEERTATAMRRSEFLSALCEDSSNSPAPTRTCRRYSSCLPVDAGVPATPGALAKSPVRTPTKANRSEASRSESKWRSEAAVGMSIGIPRVAEPAGRNSESSSNPDGEEVTEASASKEAAVRGRIPCSPSSARSSGVVSGSSSSHEDPLQSGFREIQRRRRHEYPLQSCPPTDSKMTPTAMTPTALRVRLCAIDVPLKYPEGSPQGSRPQEFHQRILQDLRRKSGATGDIVAATGEARS